MPERSEPSACWRVDRVVQRLGERVQLRGIRGRVGLVEEIPVGVLERVQRAAGEGAGGELRIHLGARDRRRAGGRRDDGQARDDHRRAVLVVVGDAGDVRQLAELVEQQVPAIEQVVRRLAGLHDLQRRRIDLRSGQHQLADLGVEGGDLGEHRVRLGDVGVDLGVVVRPHGGERGRGVVERRRQRLAGLRERLPRGQRLRRVGHVVPGVEEVLDERLDAVVGGLGDRQARSRAARGSARRARPGRSSRRAAARR